MSLTVSPAGGGTTLTNSASLRTALSDENGTGVALFDSATNPTFVGATLTGQLLNSTAGAASAPAKYMTGAWYAAGTGTTTFPHLFMQATGTTASTTWSTAGTGIGVNAVTGFTGNFIDCKLAGASTSAFKVSSTGAITTGAGSYVFLDVSGNLSVAEVAVTGGGSPNVRLYAPASGVLRIFNGTNNGFTRLDFGDNTNSYGAIGRDAVNGLTIQSAAGTATWNDASTAGSGTVANRYLFGIAAPTLTATNSSVTDTVASTVYIGGAPVASTNTTITTPYALNVAAGVSNFGGPVVMSPGYTVATLPSTAATGRVTGARAYVTDATAPTYLGTLTGGGAVVCPVFYNGTAWVS